MAVGDELDSGSGAIATFIGIDLAWQSDKNHTGAAAFRGNSESVTCIGLSSGISSLDGVRAFLAEHEESETIVAIDAPLIINNESGQRPCETIVSKRFSRFHAGAHTSNRALYPKAGSVELARRLESSGYTHCPAPEDPRQTKARWFFEVYPHPAHVVLFERNRIIKYKKGRVSQRRVGLHELQNEIRSRVFGPNSPFLLDSTVGEFLSQNPDDLRGRALKEYEDILDSILCAYLAFHLWKWGWQQNEMLGDLSSGYIVVPKFPLRADSFPA